MHEEMIKKIYKALDLAITARVGVQITYPQSVLLREILDLYEEQQERAEKRIAELEAELSILREATRMRRYPAEKPGDESVLCTDGVNYYQAYTGKLSEYVGIIGWWPLPKPEVLP